VGIEVTNIGIIGCGNISTIYLDNCTKVFRNLRVAAVADQVHERALAKAVEYGIHACTVEQMLADESIGIILNLTIPNAHFDVCLAALNAGKSVYVEKPLSIGLEEGEQLSALAAEKGLRIGCAPDTFLGSGLQTCRRLIDDGWIGDVVGGTAFMLCGGHESWHPDPAFYYRRGGGPMFDMGPYYTTALIALLGPVARVSGLAKTTFARRTITSAPKFGEEIEVEVPTHVTGLLDFESGASVTLTTSFDVAGGSAHNPVEIWGTEGTLQVPDPNTFGGPIRLRRKGASAWSEIPLRYGYAENSRGLGLSDMADGIREGRPHRASGNLALHALEIMHGIHIASDERRVYELRHRCERPQPLA